MMLLNKLPGFQPVPAGLERSVLRRLPLITVAGTAVLIAGALATALLLGGSEPGAAKFATSIQIALASALVLHWSVAFTVAMVCVFVTIAKGPAYVADAYELIDAEQPARRSHAH